MTPWISDVFIVSLGFERNTIPLGRNNFGILTRLGTNLAKVLCDSPNCNCNDVMNPLCFYP